MSEYKREDFKQLIHLESEIKMLAREAAELSLKALPGSMSYENADMPKATERKDMICESVTDKVEVLEVIEYAKEQCVKEYLRIFNLIRTVDDSEMRKILFYRYCKALEWKDVAKEINSTYDAVISKDKRFFARYKDCDENR